MFIQADEADLKFSLHFLFGVAWQKIEKIEKSINLLRGLIGVNVLRLA